MIAIVSSSRSDADARQPGRSKTRPPPRSSIPTPARLPPNNPKLTATHWPAFTPPRWPGIRPALTAVARNRNFLGIRGDADTACGSHGKRFQPQKQLSHQLFIAFHLASLRKWFSLKRDAVTLCHRHEDVSFNIRHIGRHSAILSEDLQGASDDRLRYRLLFGRRDLRMLEGVIGEQSGSRLQPSPSAGILVGQIELQEHSVMPEWPRDLRMSPAAITVWREGCGALMDGFVLSLSRTHSHASSLTCGGPPTTRCPPFRRSCFTLSRPIFSHWSKRAWRPHHFGNQNHATSARASSLLGQALTDEQADALIYPMSVDRRLHLLRKSCKSSTWQNSKLGF